jgi:hypothetical protein
MVSSSYSIRRRTTSPDSMADGGEPHPHAALWEATAIQGIKALIPVTLDLKASNFTKWRNFVVVAVSQHALGDQLDTSTPPSDADTM